MVEYIHGRVYIQNVYMVEYTYGVYGGTFTKRNIQMEGIYTWKNVHRGIYIEGHIWWYIHTRSGHLRPETVNRQSLFT